MCEDTHEDAAQLVQHPVGGRIEPLQMFFRPARHLDKSPRRQTRTAASMALVRKKAASLGRQHGEGGFETLSALRGDVLLDFGPISCRSAQKTMLGS